MLDMSPDSSMDGEGLGAPDCSPSAKEWRFYLTVTSMGFQGCR
jgi:hypothetical protein